MSEIQRRGYTRGTITKIINAIEKFLTDANQDESILEVKLKMLKKHREKLESLDEKIQSNLEGEVLEIDMDECLERETEIEECILAAEKKLEHFRNLKRSATTSMNGALSKVVKLPTLQLPTFSGTPLEWPHFWDSYQSSVHLRTDLTGAQKFTYLTGQLRDDALHMLDGFSATDLHYDEAIKLLEETYGKPNQIIQAHLDELFDLKCQKATSKDLSKFRATYECHLRGLKTMKTNVTEAGFVFVGILIRKLPARIRDNINRAHGSDSWTLETFRQAINREIEMLTSGETEDFMPIAENKESLQQAKVFTKNKHFGSSKFKSTAGSFSISTDGATSNPTSSCKYCFDRHFSDQCEKYETIEKRTEKVKELNLCFNCLLNSHSVSACKSKFNCRICNKRHHSSLCFKGNNSEAKKKREKETTKTATVVASIHQEQTRQSTALPTAIVPIRNKRPVRALFDQGSQRSFILQATVEELQLKIYKKVTLCVDGFASKGKEKSYDVVVFVAEISGGIQIEAVVVESLPSRIKVYGATKLLNLLQSSGVRVADPIVHQDTVNNIEILIGADQYYNFVNGQTMWGNIYLLSSNLGMMLTGPIPEKRCSRLNHPIEVSSVLYETESEHSPEENIKKLWSLDSLGIQIDSEDSEQSSVMNKFEDSIVYKDGQYTVCLPWREDHRDKLTSNYNLAKGRLKSTLSRLRKEPNHLKIYNQILDDHLARNFIERVDDDEVCRNKGRLHYLPHHGVQRNSATTPLRIVFDCSAGNPSLNECIHTGPSLINDLCKVLLRFRIGEYACISDISKAFLMIGLRKTDRNATCFLWPKDPLDENSELSTFRFKVVLFGAKCSPFLLNATIRHHLRKSGSSFAESMQRNFYVDNLQATASDEIQLVKFYEESKQMMLEANLTLREWATNSELLQNKINLNGDGRMNFQSDPSVLGMYWKIEGDFLRFPDIELSMKQIHFTKRNVLSVVSKVFDPLGLLTPVTIRARIFMQELWKLKLGWDEIISSEEQFKIVSSVLRDLREAMNIGVPRLAISGKSISLHAFSDASAKAYGAVVYAISDGKSKFIISKARVTPLKNLTIPKLELTAAVLATRLIAYVVETYSSDLTFDNVDYWTDSQVVLCWLSSKKKLKSYEQNRVKEILIKSEIKQWHYINTKINPADMLSRGTKPISLISSDLWFHGPSWIAVKTEWPQEFILPTDFIEEAEHAYSVAVTTPEPEELTIIDVSRFGTLRKLLRTTAIVFKFMKMLKTRSYSTTEKLIDAKDMDEAKKYWFSMIQSQTFKEEINYLKNQKGKAPNLVSQLNLLFEDGLLRCHGRIAYSNIEWSAKFPIILPTDHHFTELIIKEAHVKVNHLGVSSVIAFLRQEVWIPKIRQKVKSVIKPCIACKKVQGKPYAVPNCPPLPELRVRETRPFTVTGVDYTGALMIKDGKVISKVYIVLFTCAVTRAVHLEVVQDNSCETFIRAFRRFVARRACPRHMISDNATTFTAASKFIKKLQEDDKIQRELSDLFCNWSFIPSRAAWFGGMWERMIGITKSTLKKILGRAFITLEELQTIIVEVECGINDRPITYSSNNVDDLQALTPSHLLYGYRLRTLPDPVNDSDHDYNDRSMLTARQQSYSNLKSRLWKRWHSEYLLALRERQLKTKLHKCQLIQIGDVVLVHDDLKRRLHWKLGKILKLFVSQDGAIRSVLVKTTSGELTRPIAKLYPLEIRSESTNDSEEEITAIDVQRPRRQAAINARKAIANQNA